MSAACNCNQGRSGCTCRPQDPDQHLVLPSAVLCGLACLAIVALTGCSSTKPPETSIYCSVTGDKATALNNIGPAQVGLRINPAQVHVLCKPAVPASGVK